MTTTPSLEDLIEWLNTSEIDNHKYGKVRSSIEAIRTRLLAAQKMHEALISVSPQKDGLSFNVANKVANALEEWEGK